MRKDSLSVTTIVTAARINASVAKVVNSAIHTVTPAIQSAKIMNTHHGVYCCDVIVLTQWSVCQSFRQGSPRAHLHVVGGDAAVYVFDINQRSLPTPSYSVFMALFSCILFHKFSRQLCALSFCSSGHISALIVLSAINLLQP